MKTKRRDCKLANLFPEVQEAVEELVNMYGLTFTAEKLRKKKEDGGMDLFVSTATLSRFMRERAEQRLKENREQVSEAVSEMAAVDRKEFRKGTIAMLQQRIYEDTVATGSSEKVREAYEMLISQEQRERELEVAERHAAVAEENAKAARRRAELAAASSALALLPKLREILLREGAPEAEILQEARKCLLAGGGELMRIAEKSGATG
jgi:pyruvate-formate lyase